MTRNSHIPFSYFSSSWLKYVSLTLRSIWFITTARSLLFSTLFLRFDFFKNFSMLLAKELVYLFLFLYWPERTGLLFLLILSFAENSLLFLQIIPAIFLSTLGLYVYGKKLSPWRKKVKPNIYVIKKTDNASSRLSKFHQCTLTHCTTWALCVSRVTSNQFFCCGSLRSASGTHSYHRISYPVIESFPKL